MATMTVRLICGFNVWEMPLSERLAEMSELEVPYYAPHYSAAYLGMADLDAVPMRDNHRFRHRHTGQGFFPCHIHDPNLGRHLVPYVDVDPSIIFPWGRCVTGNEKDALASMAFLIGQVDLFRAALEFYAHGGRDNGCTAKFVLGAGD